jgi:phytoene synthase
MKHTDIERAYEHCRRITLRHAKTFYFASHFLGRDKRNACYAVYAFCRWVDDLVDVAVETEDVTVDDAKHLISEFRHAMRKAHEHRTSANPILTAWDDVQQRYQIPEHLPDELIEGVLMDTFLTRFATFEDLRVYCYKVASVVGLMTSEIFRYSSPVCLDQAVDLGIAMQLTNIIRDVAEDAERGRIYLPQEDMQRFGVTEEDILARRSTPQFIELMRYYVQRADEFYEQADLGIPCLEPDSRMTVLLMSRNYRKILREVELLCYDVMKKRASTSTMSKMLSVPRAWREARGMSVTRGDRSHPRS